MVKINTDRIFVFMCKSVLVLYPLLFITISYILYDMVNGSGYTAELILSISGPGEQRTKPIMDVWVFPLLVINPWFMAIIFSYGIWGRNKNKEKIK